MNYYSALVMDRTSWQFFFLAAIMNLLVDPGGVGMPSERLHLAMADMVCHVSNT